MFRLQVLTLPVQQLVGRRAQERLAQNLALLPAEFVGKPALHALRVWAPLGRRECGFTSVRRSLGHAERGFESCIAYELASSGLWCGQSLALLELGPVAVPDCLSDAL